MLRRLMMMTPILAVAFVLGCGGTAPDDNENSTQVSTNSKQGGGHNHNGWWCSEHGVPEAECALCDPKVAAEFQKKGDWCDEHNRPKSQCFTCDPTLKDKFASVYEAKFGEKPPAME